MLARWVDRNGPPKHDDAEVDYDAYLTPWFDVMPNLQYIVNPDGLGNLPYPKSNLNDAFVVGVQIKIDLATLAGLPSSL